MGFQAGAFILLARTLGPEQFGALAAALAAANLIAPFVEYGANNIVVRDVVAGIPTPRTVGLGLALSALVLPAGLGVLCAVKLLLLPQIGWGVVVLVGLTTFFGNRMTLLANGASMAHGMLWRNTIVEVMNGVTLFVLAFVFSRGGAGIETWVIWALLQSLFIGTLALAWVARTWGRLSWSLAELRDRLQDGFHFAVNGAATNAYADLDKALLARLATLETVGVFTAAHRMVVLAAVPLAAFLGAIYPRFFSSGQNGLPEARRFAWRVIPATVGYGLVAAVSAWFLAPFLVGLLGVGYGETVDAIRWLCWIVPVQGIQLPFLEALTGSGHQPARTLGQVFALTISVGLNVILIPTLGWQGSAIATLFGQVFLTAFIIWRCYTLTPGCTQARTARAK